MRVAMIVRALPVHRHGGLEHHAFDLAHALQSAGCRITIVTSRHPRGLAYEHLDSGVEIHYLPRGPVGDYSIGFLRGVEQRVAQLDARQPFDIIHAQEFAGLLMKPRPGRFVVTVHGTLTSETPLDRRYLAHLSAPQKLRAAWCNKNRLALLPLFRRMLERADHLIVDSHFSQRELLRMAPRLRSRLTVVRLGIDWHRYELPRTPPPKFPAPPLRIVLLGRVQPWRGLADALAAAYRLRWHGIDFRMRIAGTATPPDWIDDAIHHFLLQDVVLYEGPLPAERVSDLLAWGDLFLFPDRTQPAFGLACVEAMAHGLPVLATRVGAVPEIVSDDVGWLCEPWNVQDMTAQLVRVATLTDEARRKAERAWHYGRTFCAETMAHQTLLAYESLLRSKPAPVLPLDSLSLAAAPDGESGPAPAAPPTRAGG